MPGTDKRDWIRLVSGEWLAGKLKHLRDENLEFDSDKLDLLQIEWKDVRELRSPRVLTLAFTEKRVAVGSVAMRDSVLRVLEDGQTHEFRVSELLTIVEGGSNEWERWSGKLSFGFVSRSGNTDQVDLNSLSSLRRDGPNTLLDFRYASNIGELSGVQNVRNQLGSGRLDVFLSRNLFVTPVAAEVYSDEFQNVDLRTSLAAGVGWYLFRHSKLEWFIQAGMGYLATRYSSVAPGEDLRDTGGSLMPLTSLEWKIAKDVDLDVDFSSNFSLPDTEKRFHHFLALLTIENLKVVDLTTSVTWDHVAQPKARDDGSRPDQNDVRTSFGIGVDF